LDGNITLFGTEVPRRQIHATAIALPTPGPTPKDGPSMHRKATSLRVPAVNGQGSALAQFHALAGHAGPTDGCRDCADQLKRQRSATTALRTHQNQARQHVDAILDGAVSA